MRSGRVRRPIGSWHVVAMDLWYSPGRADPEAAANTGLPRAVELLGRAAAGRPEAVRLIDVSDFAEFERWQLYALHARRCAYWGYALAEVFGSRARAGSYAGLTVPLLSVHFREAAVPCAAPHRVSEHDAEDGVRRSLRTILDLLRLVDRSEQFRLFGETA
jgi:hypothetical protein